MRIVINGILKEFPQIKDEKPKVKVEKLNLSKLKYSLEGSGYQIDYILTIK